MNRRDAETERYASVFLSSPASQGLSGEKVMAQLKDKLPDNIRGEFYVDSQCIDCDVCRDTSPANFRRNDDNGYSYVYKQPETPEEFQLCEEASKACPVEAIGDDAVEKALARG